MTRASPRIDRDQSFILLISLLLAVSMLPPTVAAAGHDSPPPSDEVFHVKNGVYAWERSAFPLRADTSDAIWTVPNAAWFLEDVGNNARDLNKDRVGVYSNGSTVELTFDDQRASTTGLADRNVTVVAAYITENADVTDATTISGALDLLTTSNVNSNATFETVASNTQLDSSGEKTVQHTPSKSGHWLYFVATREPGKAGLTDSGGDISIDGNVTVVGVEHVVVEETAASVSPPTRTVPPGNDFTVNVDSNLDGNVTHAFVLYDEDTYKDQQFTLKAETEIDRNFTLGNATLKTDVASVNGVGDVDGPVEVLGFEVGDGEASGKVGVGSIVDFVVDRANTSAPNTTTTNSVVLDGSAVVFEADADPSPFTVQTFGNWSEGTYRWIYVGSEVDSTKISTDRGTVEIGTPAPPSRAGGRRDGGGVVAIGAPTVTPPAAPGRPVTVQVSIEGARPDRPAQIPIPDDVVDDEFSRSGSALEGLDITPRGGANFEVSVTQDDAPPAGTPPIEESLPDVSGVTYVDVEHTLSDTLVDGATFTFRVSPERVQALGGPENMALFRYDPDAGQWETKDADLEWEQRDDGTFVFTGTTDTLSVYVVGSRRANIAVSAAALSTSSIAPGEAITVSATLDNAGAGAGEYTLELLVDGSVVDSRTVRVPAGESLEVSFERTFAEAGDYEIAVSGVEAGTLSVAAEATPPPQTPIVETPGEAGPGAGAGGPPLGLEPGGFATGVLVLVVIIVVALGLFAVLRKRR